MALILRLHLFGVALVTLCLSSGLCATANAEPVDRGGPATRSDVAEKFIGTWRLKWAVTRDETGNTQPFYADPVGKLTYTAQGDVWALTGSRGQPGVWYTGTFDVRPKIHTVVHHVQYSSILPWEGTDLTRRYRFRGNSLRLTAELSPGTSLVLMWKRV
jgi:hypothetical protein